jgi:hypothetical protein
MLEYAIETGKRGVYLRLTPEQEAATIGLATRRRTSPSRFF